MKRHLMDQNVTAESYESSFNTHALTRIAAALGNVGHSESLPLLQRWNRHTQATVREHAVRALRLYPQEAVEELLLDHLTGPRETHDVDVSLEFDVEVVETALDVIGNSDAPSRRVLHTLTSYLDDFDRCGACVVVTTRSD